MIFHFAAEYNATRKYGVDFDMNEIMRRFEQNNWDDNRDYLGRTQIQVKLLARWMRLRQDEYEVHYDDVSRVPGNGKHSDAQVYFQNVRESIEYHQELFTKLKPVGIIIAGGLAFQAFEQILYPVLKHRPDYIIRMRNPSSQGHWGKPADWLQRYKDAVALQPKGGGTLEVMSFQTKHNRFSLRPFATKLSAPTENVRKATVSSDNPLTWDDFVEQMERLDIYISDGPDRQDRYKFAKDDDKIFIEVKRTKVGDLGAGYFQYKFGRRYQEFIFKDHTYHLNCTGRINIREAMNKGDFFALLQKVLNQD